jgi:flagellar motor switch protein FliN/FliY
MTEKSREPMAVHSVELEDLVSAGSNSEPILGRNLDVIKKVKMKLEVYLGEADLTVGELFELQENSIVKLDREVSAPVDIVLDGNVVARGDLVVVDDNFGVRITQISR